MRLFVAIKFPNEDYTRNVQQELIDNSAKLKFTSSFHITLKFLGEVNREELPNIISKLNKINFRKFRLNSDKIGTFPNKKNIKVIWLGIEQSEDLLELQRKIDKSLPGESKFHPHVTLARVSFMKDKKSLINTLNRIENTKMPFEVNKFILYESHLTPKGPIYSVIKEFKAL